MASLLTYDDAVAFLKLPNINNNEEAVLTILVESVWDSIEGYCGRKFDGSADITEVYEGSGSRKLLLKQYPVISITTVTRTKEDAADTEVVVASTEYKIDLPGGMLVMHPVNYSDSSIWVVGDLNYSIVYKAGYTAATLPGAIKLAWEIWVSILFAKAKDNIFGVSSSTFNEQTLTFDNEKIPKQVAGMLHPYRRLR